MFRECAVIIPAYNPEEELLPYVEELIQHGVEEVIVVNDGSFPETEPIFSRLREQVGCTVLVHTENRGKGRALKTAFAYLKEKEPQIQTIVTADADGQHAVKDVLALFRALQKEPTGIVLGVRDFNEKQVPRKNAFGNKLTSRVFKILFGTYVTDTQTGLRGFVRAELDWLLYLKGERFEYEMNMLMYVVQMAIPIQEVPIQTLYFGKKPATHYKTFRDSCRIAKQLAVGFMIKGKLVEEPDFS